MPLIEIPTFSNPLHIGQILSKLNGSVDFHSTGTEARRLCYYTLPSIARMQG